jgi:hypothetical protein
VKTDYIRQAFLGQTVGEIGFAVHEESRDGAL